LARVRKHWRSAQPNTRRIREKERPGPRGESKKKRNGRTSGQKVTVKTPGTNEYNWEPQHCTEY